MSRSCAPPNQLLPPTSLYTQHLMPEFEELSCDVVAVSADSRGKACSFVSAAGWGAAALGLERAGACSEPPLSRQRPPHPCRSQVDDLRGAVLAVSPDTRAGRIGFKARPPLLLSCLRAAGGCCWMRPGPCHPRASPCSPHPRPPAPTSGGVRAGPGAGAALGALHLSPAGTGGVGQPVLGWVARGWVMGARGSQAPRARQRWQGVWATLPSCPSHHLARSPTCRAGAVPGEPSGPAARHRLLQRLLCAPRPQADCAGWVRRRWGARAGRLAAQVASAPHGACPSALVPADVGGASLPPQASR